MLLACLRGQSAVTWSDQSSDRRVNAGSKMGSPQLAGIESRISCELKFARSRPSLHVDEQARLHSACRRQQRTPQARTRRSLQSLLRRPESLDCLGLQRPRPRAQRYVALPPRVAGSCRRRIVLERHTKVRCPMLLRRTPPLSAPPKPLKRLYASCSIPHAADGSSTSSSGQTRESRGRENRVYPWGTGFARQRNFASRLTIERYGIDAKLFDWSDEITADCPRANRR